MEEDACPGGGELDPRGERRPQAPEQRLDARARAPQADDRVVLRAGSQARVGGVWGSVLWVMVKGPGLAFAHRRRKSLGEVGGLALP